MESFSIFVDQGPIVYLGNDTSLCTNDIYLLDATSTDATYLWQDNSTNPVFSVSQPGTYWVQVSDSCTITTDTVVIQYHTYPTVFIGNDTILCDGEVLALNATTTNATYLWNISDITPTISVQTTGTYLVAVTVNGCTTYDTILTNFTPNPVVNLGNDTILCEGESILLHANNTNATYLWQDGSINASLWVNSSGTYWVSASIYNCTTSDTIAIDYIQLPDPDLGSDTSLCAGETITLDGYVPNVTYAWQDGSTNTSFTVTQQGTYWVETTNICATVAETIVVTYHPIQL